MLYCHCSYNTALFASVSRVQIYNTGEYCNHRQSGVPDALVELPVQCALAGDMDYATSETLDVENLDVHL